MITVPKWLLIVLVLISCSVITYALARLLFYMINRYLESVSEKDDRKKMFCKVEEIDLKVDLLDRHFIRLVSDIEKLLEQKGADDE